MTPLIFHFWDPVVNKDVDAYNQDWGYKPGDKEYLDPNYVKAMIETESGPNLHAYLTDPMQVNKTLDWVPEKADLGLTKGVAPGAALSIQAGIEWLTYKSYHYDVNGNETFAGWTCGIYRYNGGGDPLYLEKVMDHYQQLSIQTTLFSPNISIWSPQ